MKFERLLAVFQPHRYSRTLALGSDFPASFEGLEHLWLVPVYAASEQSIEGGTTGDLAGRFPAQWESRITCCSSLEDAWSDIRPRLRAGDFLLVIGAGDIEQLSDWAREL
jgi:UDP-N-acetylmuramate--alanine ligase